MDTGGGSRSKGRHLSFPVMNSSTCDQVVDEWKECISIVDNSMTSLANALDMMHAIVHSTTGNSWDKEEHGDKLFVESHSLRNLLISIEKTVLHDGHFAISNVTTFIHTVISAVAKISGTSVDEFAPLTLDTYRRENKQTDISKILQVRKLEMLTQENSDLREEEKRLQSQISVLSDKEIGFLEEIKNLRDKIKCLEKCKEQLDEQHKQSEESKSQLEKDITKLRADYKESCLTKIGIKVMEERNKEMISKYRRLQKEHEECLKSKSKEKDIANDEYEKKIADLTNEVDVVVSSLKDKDAEINAATMSIQNFSQTIKQLQNEIEEKNKLINCYRKRIQEKEEEVQNRMTELSQLSAKNKDIVSKSDLEKETNRRQNMNNAATIEKLKLQLEDTRKKYEDKENLKQKYDELKERHDSIIEALQSKDRQVDNLKTELKQLHSFECQNTELKDQLNKLKNDFRKLSDEKESLHKDLKNEKTIHRNTLKMNIDLRKTVDELFADKDNLQTRLNQTSETNQRLVSENERLMKHISNLNQELEMYKRKKLIQVQLYYQRRGELITTVEEELTRILKRRIESTGKTEIEFVKCVHTSDVNTELPLLLLCISASRIGTDAANTVHGLQLSSKMSLLIFHHKDVHALPSQASYQVLTGGEFKAMSGIFDLAFLSGKGIYSCPLNDNSIDKIVTFINTESDSGSVCGLSR